MRNIGWKAIYSGKDEDEFRAVCDKLSAAGIRHKTTAFDASARMLLQQMQAPQASSPLSKNPSNADYVRMQGLSNNALDQYAVTVRTRDFSKARACI